MGNESKYNGPRYLWVPYEGREIRWTKGTQPHPTKSKSMPLDQVRAVRVGRPSKLAKKELKSSAWCSRGERRWSLTRCVPVAVEDPGEVCFTLVHAQAKRSLDVRAADSGQLKQWVAGLRALLGSAGGGEARA